MVLVCVLEIRTANNSRKPNRNPPYWLSRQHLPILTPRPIIWVTRWYVFLFVIFSWAVLCDYTKCRDWLLFMLLSQIWPEFFRGTHLRWSEKPNLLNKCWFSTCRLHPLFLKMCLDTICLISGIYNFLIFWVDMSLIFPPLSSPSTTDYEFLAIGF